MAFVLVACNAGFGQSQYSERSPSPQHSDFYEGRRLSATGGWRYDQARRSYYQAIARLNQIAIEEADLSITNARIARRELRAIQRRLRVEATRARVEGRRDRSSSKARQLWLDVESKEFEWPLILRDRSFQIPLQAAIKALRDPYAADVATVSLREVRRLLKEHGDRYSDLGRARAYRVLTSLEQFADDGGPLVLVSR